MLLVALVIVVFVVVLVLVLVSFIVLAVLVAVLAAAAALVVAVLAVVGAHTPRGFRERYSRVPASRSRIGLLLRGAAAASSIACSLYIVRVGFAYTSTSAQ